MSCVCVCVCVCARARVRARVRVRKCACTSVGHLIAALQEHVLEGKKGDCGRGVYLPNVSLTKSPVMPTSISEITKSLPLPSSPVCAAHALMMAPDSGITLPSSRVQMGSWPLGVVGFTSSHLSLATSFEKGPMETGWPS